MPTFDDQCPTQEHFVTRVPQKSVGFTLSQIGLENARQFALVAGQFGLEPRHFAVLHALADRDGLSQQSVGDNLSIPASTMVSIVDHLESAGLVERHLEPHDRRTRVLHLTGAGRARLTDALRGAHEHEARICFNFTAIERAELLSLLERVATNLGIAPNSLPDHGSGTHPEH